MGFEPHPDQIELGRILDSGTETVAVCWPRRAGKTTGVQAWLVGKCENEPGTQVVMTAQTGVKARDRFMAMARLLDRLWPESEGGPHIYRGAGHEALEFTNGSRLWVVAPKPENFRGDSAHVVYVDEPQEFSPAEGDDIRQAAMPLFDTVDGGQFVLSGTPGPVRAGLFWDALAAGRRGEPGFAVSEFALPDHDDPEDEALWPSVHPGLRHGLTTLDKMRARRAGLAASQWAQEYMGWWPTDVSVSAVNAERFTTSEVEFTERPERVGIAFDVRADGSSATLACAWRDEGGNAYVEVIGHQLGTSWLPKMAYQMWQAHKRYSIGYNQIGANMDPATALQMMRPAAKVNGIRVNEVAAASQRLVSDVAEGRLRHFGQSDLTAAVENSGWRDVQGGRAFTERIKAGAPINPLVACALALWEYDKTREKRKYVMP